MIAAYLKPEIAAEIWGNDPRGILAWGAGPQGLARVVDRGYRVTGTWSFASGCRHATWLGGHSRVQERDGTLRCGLKGEPIERTMLFRKAEAAVDGNWNVIGLRGTGSVTYSVADLFVPDDFSACRDDPEECRHPTTLYRFSTNQLYAVGFAAVSLGIARALLEALKALATEKTPRASRQALRYSPIIQTHVAFAEAKLNAARCFLLTVLQTIWDEVQFIGPMSLEQRMRIRLAASFAIHQAKEVADMAYREAGATAIFQEHPFERRFRDMNALTQQVQGRTAHFEAVGAHILGLTPDLTFI